ncbi:hypothetical protein NAEGRDRAFT_58544 [Naegleria gruberi]|uniref:HECT domain-containing protein n=1 Tax=Naegleria gruberi TaxID=5762 RepID=D2VKW6_NAEGR|nr:uncharacterized protein NAEGRDRAFT_58544 [Naegleria gruberi]EFC42514.1 hypothetical protein NAEGRDRAFT_58544 [Naegleria gruberi]|eukprot:XP_002675258.1 hypothetical protein NAEGRDRAFT_58544 [Naegleria gruberi strain NEG-M]
MIRRIFTSSATDDDVLDVMEEYEKNSKRYSIESDEGLLETKRNESNNNTQTDGSTPTSSETTSDSAHYSPNSYFDIFTKMSKSKKHTNKISSISIDNRHKNNTIYTSGMDGISCRWMINHSKNRSSVQIDLPSSSLTSNSSLPEIEDFSKSIQLDFMYEKLPSLIITQHLFNEFLFVSTDDMMLTLFYIHNEKPMFKIKCNQVVTCIFAFECTNNSNDMNIAGNVCVGLRNGEFNMYSIQKQYSKLGKWVGTALIPNESFNRNYTPRHFRQINYIGLLNSKEVMECYELNKSSAHTNSLLISSSSSSGGGGNSGMAASSLNVTASQQSTSSMTSQSSSVANSNSSSGAGGGSSSTVTSGAASTFVEVDYTKVNYHIKEPITDQMLLITASNDCFVKIWTISGGELIFMKEFDSPCTKVVTTSFRKDTIRTRFFFVSHSNDISIFSLTGKAKHPADFRVHFNINQFFLHQVPESFDQNLNSSPSNLAGKSPSKSRRDRGYSTALSAKDSSNSTSQSGSTNKYVEIPVSKNGYIYLIGWNSMQARMEVWLYNLHDQKTKPISQYQQKILGVTFLQNLVLDRTHTNQFGTDLITTFTVMYSCYKKLYIKNLILRKSLLESSKKPILIVPSILSSAISVDMSSPPTEAILPQKYCNSNFSDLYYTITTKKVLEMRNPVKVAQIIQNHFKELAEMESMEAKINFIQQVYSNSSKVPEMRFNFVLNISHQVTCHDTELVAKSKHALELLNQEVLQSRKGTSLHKKFMYIREVSLKMGEAKLTVLNYDSYIPLLADFCKPDSIERLRNVQVSSSSSRRLAIHIQDLFKIFFTTVKTTKHTYKLHPKPFDELPNLIVERVGCKHMTEVYKGLGRLLAFIIIQPYLFIEDFFPTHVILKTLLGLPIQFTDFADFGSQYLALKHVVEKRQDGSKKLSELIPEEILEEFHLSHDEELAKIMSTNVSEDNKIQLIRQSVMRLMLLNISTELENILYGTYEFLPSLDCVRTLMDENELNSLFVGTKILHNDYVLYKKPSNGNDLLSVNQMMENDPMVAWLWEFIYDDMDPAIVADNLRSCWISKKCLVVKNDLMYYNPFPIISRDENLVDDVIFRPEEQELCIGTFQDKEKFFSCLLHHIEQNAGRRSTITGQSPLPLTPRQHSDSIFDQSTYSSSLSSLSSSPLLKTM